MSARCRFCGHHPHPDRPCIVKHVTGPAVNTAAGSGYRPEEHTGRTVTSCGCTDYLPTTNGAELI